MRTLSVVSRGGSELYSTDVGDLGQPDVWAAGSDALVLGATAAVTVYATDDLAFRTPLNTVVALDAILTQVEEADFTADGIDDHIVVSETYPDDYGPGKVWILDGADRGLTDGEADAYASLTGNDATGLIGSAPRPADINGDGRLDLVVQDHGLSIYDGSVPGVMDPSAPMTRLSDICHGQVADFDGDGIADIVGVAQDEDITSKSAGFGVLFGTPAGTTDFANSVDWRMGEGDSGRIVALDIDTDGDDDIVFQGGTEGLTYLFNGGPERATE